MDLNLEVMLNPVYNENMYLTVVSSFSGPLRVLQYLHLLLLLLLLLFLLWEM